MEWARQEFKDLDLYDKRLNRRVSKLTQALYESPMHSIGKACESWRDTKAAYRLFSNDKVKSEKILEAHRKRTINRAKNYDVILAIQDTTFLDLKQYLNRELLGFHDPRKETGHGLLMHSNLLVTTQGLPLGLMDQKIFKRQFSDSASNCGKRYGIPSEKKESFRWIEASESLFANINQKSTKAVIVGDREADIFELLLFCSDMKSDYLVRSCWNRIVGERKKRKQGESIAQERLEDFLDEQPVRGKIKILVHDQKTRAERLAKLSIKFAQVQFPAPHGYHKDQNYPIIGAYVIEAYEEGAPQGKEPVHWKLLTSLEVKTLSEAIEKINWYKQRWTIEIFHKILKSGCRIESSRLATFDRLHRFLTLNSIIAWRIHWMTKLQRQTPNVPCSVVFEKLEWQTLYRHFERKVPKTTPSVREAIRKMAQMGGFLGRKCDGEPGIQTIWIGWSQLQTMVKTVRSATYG